MLAGLADRGTARPRSARVLLIVFPMALFIYLSVQVRWFGRWLLPTYPALALLAGVAIAWVARRVPCGADPAGGGPRAALASP